MMLPNMTPDVTAIKRPVWEEVEKMKQMQRMKKIERIKK